MTRAAAPVRRIFHGDNLPRLRRMREGAADLVYLDPPFNSGRAHRGAAGGAGRVGKTAAFNDSWKWTAESEALLAETALRSRSAARILRAHADAFGRGPLAAYLTRMGATLAELRRVMAPEASIYLHCDPSISPHLRILMDAVFGAANFQNEIVWAYGLGGGSGKKFSRKHDSILFYARGRRWRFCKPQVPATSARMRGMLKGMTDVWCDIPSLNNMAGERTGYPTQKPLALLERIIAASSRPGDLVLDPFYGSGTTLLAAENLGRRWIGLDSSPVALAVASDRLLRRDRPIYTDAATLAKLQRTGKLNLESGFSFTPKAPVGD